MSRDLYDRLGGFVRVRGIVTAFYARVLESAVLEHHFRDADMRRLIDHQTKFMASLMGGPGALDEISLQRAHRHLGITRREYEEMIRLLRETLAEQGLVPSDIATVTGEMMRLQPLIVAEAA